MIQLIQELFNRKVVTEMDQERNVYAIKRVTFLLKTELLSSGIYVKNLIRYFNRMMEISVYTYFHIFCYLPFLYFFM